jgi:hypothetical protein
MLVALLLVAAVTHSPKLDVDYGQTMQRVDALRAAARYADAQSELRALDDRFKSEGINDDSDALFKRSKELLVELVELETLSQEAESDPRAARAYLAKLVSPAQPSSRTAEQAHALTLLTKHDAKVRALLDAAFPARAVVDARVAGSGTRSDEAADPNIVATPFENALVEMSAGSLPVARAAAAGASELHVHLDVYENDPHNSILEGTRMRSYAIQMSAEVVGADGAVLSKVASTTSMLGINPGFAARHGTERAAALLYGALIDDIAKRCALE